VTEAVTLAAQRGATATLSILVEILALMDGWRLRMVAIAEALAGESAGGAGLTFFERGAKTWHE
jgi:hypothetical protein